MQSLIIKNAQLVNEGIIAVADVLIKGQRIEKIAQTISDPHADVLEAEGLFLLPGVIDDQVHFREPGLTHKANIYSESRAAVAGGVTSFMDMPNTIPNTLSLDLLEEKYNLAAASSLANYSFFMGINQHNLEEALQTDPQTVCGITDDGLYFSDEKGILANYPDFLEKLFSRSNTLVALHSEDDAIIHANIQAYRKKYGEDIPVQLHPLIRSEEACVTATKRVLDIARKHNNRLHFFHISTAAEAYLFDHESPVNKKRITAEACIHHLYFSDQDYERLGSKIKWNPAVKSTYDKQKLLEALLQNHIDIIATDHAPHTIEEKSGTYFKSMSGGPLVQHSLLAMLEFYHEGKISLEQLVQKMSHNVAEIYRIIDRGYIREGYYADLVLVNPNTPTKVQKGNLLYTCGWSPFENTVFQSSISHTIVNGKIVYQQQQINEGVNGQRLKFLRDR
ncbi:MAG: dihydroorotase [Bacteroidota bacterium]|jgi:dihydroorotase